MASFTDDPIQLTPYIQQQPVEAMARVGMMKEAQFEEGIKTVQSHYDSLLSLPLYKQGIQDYVKQKVGQLNNAVRQSVSGDFSDRRLVNQIGGMASQISKDPIVEMGVQSSAKIQAGLTQAKADQERAIKEGKNPINNINDFNDAVQSYLSDGELNTSFSEYSGGYTPYVDVMERTIKAYEKLHPGQTMAADAVRWNPSTKSYEVNEVLYDGVDAQRIQGVLDMVYSQPDVQAQLAIDGRQRFKGMDANSLSAMMETSSNRQIDNIENAIRELQIKIATDNSIDKQSAEEQIKMLTKKADSLVRSNEENNSLLASGNVDGVKSSLIWNEFSGSFIDAYAYNVMKKSPAFDAFMERERLNLSLRTENRQEREFEQKSKMDLLNYQLAASKAADEKKGASLVSSVTPLSVEEQQARLGAETAETDFRNTQDSYIQKRRQLANAVAASTPPIDGQQSIPPPYVFREDVNGGTWVPNIKGIKEYYKTPNMSDKEAAEKASVLEMQIFGRTMDSYNNGKIPENLRPLYEEQLNLFYTLKDKERIIQQAETEVAPLKEKVKQQIANEDFFSIYAIQNGLPGAEAEATKLLKKYGAKILEGSVGLQDSAAAISVIPTDVKDRAELAKKVFVENILRLNLPGAKPETLKMFKSLGIDLNAYLTAAGKVSPKDASDYLTTREASYKRQQYALNSNKVTFDISKTEKKVDILTKMGSLAQEPSLLGGRSKSDYDDFMKQMDEDKTGKFTSLNAYYDENKKMGFIQGFKGDKEYSFEVPKEALQTVFPDVVAENSFRLYEQRMRYANERRGARTTDVTGLGTEGYQVYHPLYDVRYHVDEIGDKYNIKLYVTDRTGKKIINGESFFAPVEKGSVSPLVKQNLENLEFINQIVQRKTVDAQLNSAGK